MRLVHRAERTVGCSNNRKSDVPGKGRSETFVGTKCENFFSAAFYIQFRVFPRFDNPRDVSDTPQTMSGLFSVPNITASQTI